MAQKAAKSTAKRNDQTLNRLHLQALAVHAVYIILRVLIFRASFTRSSFLRYALLSSPAIVIEFLFERNSRPKYNGPVAEGNLRSSGDDLEAKGITEWMWDVLYWTWINTALAAVAGDWAWWLYAAIPLYSAYLAYTTFTGVRQSFGGLSGANPSEIGTGSNSKRQMKLDKRGGQRMQYR